MLAKRLRRGCLVFAHEPAVARDIGGKDRRKSAFNAVLNHGTSPQAAADGCCTTKRRSLRGPARMQLPRRCSGSLTPASYRAASSSGVKAGDFRFCFGSVHCLRFNELDEVSRSIDRFVNNDALERVDVPLPRLLCQHALGMLIACAPAGADTGAGEVDVLRVIFAVKARR
jgi:hypothetical protein